MKRERPNLLAESMETPGGEALSALKSRLISSHSTWEIYSPQVSLEVTDTTPCLRAIKDDGSKLISVDDIGLCEVALGRKIRKLIEAPPEKAIALRRVDNLYPEQEEAVKLLLRSRCAALSGLPGTGKTRVIRSLYASLRASGLRVALCAFTGAAASRMGEAVGAKGYSTIHALLGYDGEGFTHHQTNPLDIDAVVMDEAGMTDIPLAWCLFRALPLHCRIYCVGDPNQLPSIGEGYFFGDMIEVVPHAALVTIRRTEEGGPIGEAAQAILSGNMPKNAEKDGQGFYGLACDDGSTSKDGPPEKLLNFSARLQRRIAEVHGCLFPHIRVMATTNKYCDYYNEYVSTRYVASPHPYISKVNRAKKGYFNGDRGYLTGDVITFENGAKDYLIKGDHALSFCDTVYRLQGRESVAGMLTIPNRGPGVPKWQEMYTAVTRFRERCVVNGNLAFFAKAIRQPHTRQRTTLLREVIQGTVEIL